MKYPFTVFKTRSLSDIFPLRADHGILAFTIPGTGPDCSADERSIRAPSYKVKCLIQFNQGERELQIQYIPVYFEMCMSHKARMKGEREEKLLPLGYWIFEVSKLGSLLDCGGYQGPAPYSRALLLLVFPPRRQRPVQIDHANPYYQTENNDPLNEPAANKGQQK